jgi:hypothetical protein
MKGSSKKKAVPCIKTPTPTDSGIKGFKYSHGGDGQKHGQPYGMGKTVRKKKV